MADLITLTKLKTALGIPDPSAAHPDDAKWSNALAASSAIIRTYTDRKFEVTPAGIPVPEGRVFEYDGSGYLDIDEAQVVTDVSASYGGPTLPQIRNLNVDEWFARPFNYPVKWWLQLPDNPLAWGSPEMGFTRNVDTYSGIGYYGYPTLITVTAVWGWPEIPEDVQQAAIWTTLHLSENPKSFTAESIEGYSRSYSAGGGTVSDDMPDRARAVLSQYIIPRV